MTIGVMSLPTSFGADVSAEEIFDDSPYSGPRPVRAGGIGDDWDAGESRGSGLAAPDEIRPRAPGVQRLPGASAAPRRVSGFPGASGSPGVRGSPGVSGSPHVHGSPGVRRSPRVRCPGRSVRPAPRPSPQLRPTTIGQRAAVSAANHSGAGVPGRRTVTIQGRGTERYNAGFERRRPARRAA